jgi:NADH-quinone oxidoreductase subunit H
MLEWIRVNIPAWFWITAAVVFVSINTVAYLILLERKIASWVQDRIGPNRVGLDFGLPFLKFMSKVNGFGQPLADGVKFIMKEDFRPAGVDRILFTLAPGLMIAVVIVSMAALPWGGVLQTTRAVPAGVDPASVVPVTATVVASSADSITYKIPFQIANLNIGVLFILATLSLAIYGVVLGGWASNNKYSFLGGLRATCNMISYEIPLGLSVLCLVLMFGTLDLTKIIEMQCHDWGGIIPAWNAFSQPLPFLMFLVCIHAEANRAPFDLAEAEQELVGGYHTEYSAMRFALFFLAEYAGMIVTSAVCVALFFGGWHIPWLEHLPSSLNWLVKPFTGNVPGQGPAYTTSVIACIVRAFVFFGKTIGIIFVFMWVRWSLPRFRFDQMMMLAWRALIPISLALLLMTAIIVYIFDGQSLEGVHGRMAIWLLAANVITLAVILFVSTLLPPAPLTNRRVTVLGSRYNKPLATSN